MAYEQAARVVSNSASFFVRLMAQRKLAFRQEVAERPILDDVIVDSVVLVLPAWYIGITVTAIF